MAGNASGGSSKKKGRSKAWCERYKKSGQREKNKMLKLVRHIRRYPNDYEVRGACHRLAQIGWHVSKYVDIPKPPQEEKSDG